MLIVRGDEQLGRALPVFNRWGTRAKAQPVSPAQEEADRCHGNRHSGPVKDEHNGSQLSLENEGGVRDTARRFGDPNWKMYVLPIIVLSRQLKNRIRNASDYRPH